MPEILSVDGFKTLGGKHCQTTALRHLLVHRGLDVTEEMLLGLGGGIGFIYWYMKQMPAPFTGTRNAKSEDFLINCCRRLGADAGIFQTASLKKAYEKLKTILKGGDPAYVFVDMAYLPYLALPEDAHFGGHTVVVVVIDEEQDRVVVADRGRFPFTVSVSDLNRAMSSTFPPFAAKNKVLQIKYPASISDETLRPGVREAIRECCTSNIEPPIKNFGLSGLQKWADLVVKWPQQFSGMNLLAALFNVFIYLEIGGTGGQAFRPMYATFLKQAGRLLAIADLDEISGMFSESAKIWQQIAHSALPDSWPSLCEIRQLSYEKNRLLENEDSGSFGKLSDINRRMEPLLETARNELADPASSRLSELTGNLRDLILKCRRVEGEAFSAMHEVINRDQ